MTLQTISISMPGGGAILGFKKPITEGWKTIAETDRVLSNSLFTPFRHFEIPDPSHFPTLARKITLPSEARWLLLKPVVADSDNPLTQKVVEWINESFNGMPKIVLQQNAQSLLREIAANCEKKLGFKKVLISEEFSDEDLDVLGITSRNALAELQKKAPHKFFLRDYVCFTYALLKAKEPGVCEVLWDGVKETELFLLWFLKWGYAPVPKPQEGDLVLYLTDGVPKHLGRYMGNGQVESKFGELTYINIHELSCANYGNQIVFYRKVKTGKYSFPGSQHGLFEKLLLKK